MAKSKPKSSRPSKRSSRPSANPSAKPSAISTPAEGSAAHVSAHASSPHASLPQAKQSRSQTQTQTHADQAPSTSTAPTPTAVETANSCQEHVNDLRHDKNLWFCITVLLHDLAQMCKDVAAQRRPSATTHELYMSAPYFTELDAQRVRTAQVDLEFMKRLAHNDWDDEQDPSQENKEESNGEDEVWKLDPDLGHTVEQVIQHRLRSFLSKRRASGDVRPCGPHDLLPIYLSVFGLSKTDLQEERFLGRLRRSRLGL